MNSFLLWIVLLFSAPVWANSMEDMLCRPPSRPVQQMEPTEKFCRSSVRALLQLPQSTANEARALLSPENLALMAAMATAWAGTQGIPLVGQAVDAALMSLGIILLTAQSAALTNALWQYANQTVTARSFADLDAAAAHLSRAVATVGVNVVAFILTKRILSQRGSGPRLPPGELVPAGGVSNAVTPPGVTRSSLQPPALAMAGSSRLPPSPEATRSQAPKAVDPEAFARWIQRARKRAARSSPAAYRYQQQQAGPEEVLVQAAGEELWADGVRMEKARLVEAKFIDVPEKSPFIAESKCPENVRRWIQQEVMEEFRRYAAIIAAPETPAVALEVVTNEARAVPFFESPLRSFGIPGEVILKP